MGDLAFEKYVKTDVDCNSNKWWQYAIKDDFSVHVVNGRVGGKGQVQEPKPFATRAQAERYIQSKIREKMRDGYLKFDSLNSGAKPSSMGRMALEMAASEQIRTQSPHIVSDLIKRLVEANVHAIVDSTELKYDDHTGVFQTPLGIVTQESIQKARSYLFKISKHVASEDFESEEIKSLLAQYLMLIPQKVGRKLVVKQVIPDSEAIGKQSGLLDDLEASIAQVEALRKQQAAGQGDAIEAPKIFNCEIDLVEDSRILEEIERLFTSTRQSMHASYSMNIKQVFAVKIDHMDSAYEGAGKLVGNIMRLWHGTRPGNILSILKNGLIIPKEVRGHTCGRAYGDGAYFSDQSTKSLNYAMGLQHRTRERQVFMFLADVAMGNYFTPRRSDPDLHLAGHDSVFAKGGQSGVINNEMIIFKTEQSTIKFLVEFH